VTRLGTALIVFGLLTLGYGGLWQLGLAPGSRVSLPPPVALEKPRAPTATPNLVALPTPVSLATPPPTSVPIVAPARLAPADQADRDDAARAAALAPTLVPTRPAPADVAERGEAALAAPAGYAVRLEIPSIKLQTQVVQGGIVEDAHGNPAWQTLPFVAVHYGDLTALVGQRSNAVIAGHVVTLSEGNVFRFLYQLDFDDEIKVWDDHDQERDYSVVDVKLVPPTDTSVMDPTPDETLTLITCGGTFDPVRREFSERLVVVAKPR
jgi:LPXTG-site transpeptidase (sortase) family protein